MARNRAGQRKPRQLVLPMRVRAKDGSMRGGRRPGAGRKNRSGASVPHKKRGKLVKSYPMHVTVRLRGGLPSMRSMKTRAVLLAKLRAGGERRSKGEERALFRLIEFSIQTNHLHLIVEAVDREAMTRGMQGLLIRIAKGLNKLWGRRGKVFFERFHEEALVSPRQVRNALVYVLHNVKKHTGDVPADGVDRFSSGLWFGGFVEPVELAKDPGNPTRPAQTWLLRTGWVQKTVGLIGFGEAPAA